MWRLFCRRLLRRNRFSSNWRGSLWSDWRFRFFFLSSFLLFFSFLHSSLSSFSGSICFIRAWSWTLVRSISFIKSNLAWFLLDWSLSCWWSLLVYWLSRRGNRFGWSLFHRRMGNFLLFNFVWRSCLLWRNRFTFAIKLWLRWRFTKTSSLWILFHWSRWCFSLRSSNGLSFVVMFWWLNFLNFRFLRRLSKGSSFWILFHWSSWAL